jgi:hypothetical protein
MRFLGIVVLLITTIGCHTCPPLPPPPQRVVKKRPQDLTDRILLDERIPDWLKRNYAEWIRYGYDLELRPR